MKSIYEPFKNGKTGHKITIPSWVPVAKAYKFELTPDRRLIYTPVVD